MIFFLVITSRPNLRAIQLPTELLRRQGGRKMKLNSGAITVKMLLRRRTALFPFAHAFPSPETRV